MYRLEQRLTGISRFKSGEYLADYQQLAQQFSAIAGSAVVLHWTFGYGARYQIYEAGQAVWEYQADEERSDHVDFLATLRATFEEVQSLVRGWSGPPLCVNIPIVADALHRVPRGAFTEENPQTRARMLNLAQTADRQLAGNTPAAAEPVLNHLLGDLAQAIAPRDRGAAADVVTAWLETLRSGPT